MPMTKSGLELRAHSLAELYPINKLFLIVLATAFSISAFALNSTNKESKITNVLEKNSITSINSNFRGAELLAYSPKKGSLEIKLQVYYSVLEHSVPEIEIVSLLASNNKIVREFELQKEIERLDVKPIKLESGLMPNPEYDSKIVSYSALIEVADSIDVLDLIWWLKKDAGLLNNVNLKQNQNLSLHITLDSTNLNPGGNSSFLGLFPYNVV